MKSLTITNALNVSIIGPRFIEIVYQSKELNSFIKDSSNKTKMNEAIVRSLKGLIFIGVPNPVNCSLNMTIRSKDNNSFDFKVSNILFK